jgi:hypothetical protein
MSGLSRRAILTLPLLLAACGGDDSSEPANAFPPLRYDYLPPIQLNVASVEIQQQFIPSGLPPDVTAADPVQPIDALKEMANDRLQSLGTSNKAVFAILNASLTREEDVIRGSLSVSLTIYDGDNAQQGYAVATVDRSHSGDIDNLGKALYAFTKALMNDMNVEFEYQVRRNLKNWLASSAAPDTPVQQDPLDQPPPR